MYKNNIIKSLVLQLFILITTLTSLVSCVETTSTKAQAKPLSKAINKSKLAYSNEANSVTIMTDDKKYITKLYSNMYPLKIGKVHSWTLEVKTSAGVPLKNTKIYVHGGMPIHQHGFPTSPRVTKHLGQGKYLVEGVKFSMPGEWEMRFNIKEKTRRDRAVYKIKL